jgi:hypothetical protein
MLRCTCGNFYTLRNSPSIICCSNCYRNSRERRPFRLRKRKAPAPVPEHADPRPAELRAAPESAPTVILVPLDDANDEPNAA